jgi:hypothetical protein
MVFGQMPAQAATSSVIAAVTNVSGLGSGVYGKMKNEK